MLQDVRMQVRYDNSNWLFVPVPFDQTRPYLFQNTTSNGTDLHLCQKKKISTHITAL